VPPAFLSQTHVIKLGYVTFVSEIEESYYGYDTGGREVFNGRRKFILIITLILRLNLQFPPLKLKKTYRRIKSSFSS
jgi:hypothetical protein